MYGVKYLNQQKKTVAALKLSTRRTNLEGDAHRKHWLNPHLEGTIRERTQQGRPQLILPSRAWLTFTVTSPTAVEAVTVWRWRAQRSTDRLRTPNVVLSTNKSRIKRSWSCGSHSTCTVNAGRLFFMKIGVTQASRLPSSSNFSVKYPATSPVMSSMLASSIHKCRVVHSDSFVPAAVSISPIGDGSRALGAADTSPSITLKILGCLSKSFVPAPMPAST